MDTAQFQPIINFIWGVADDLLRDVYVKGKYRDVILPMTVIRRLDAMLEPTKERVIKTYQAYKDKLENVDLLLTGAQGSGMSFYNYSKFTLQSLCDDPKSIRANFENYLDSFSPNIQDIISKFKFKNQLDTLEEAGILFEVIERFCSPKINLSINPTLDPQGLIRSNASILLYGQEINPETYAICKADMLIKGENPDNIKYGSTLSEDKLGNLQFDFMLTNPPYGKSWEKDQKALDVEKKGGKTSCSDPRFQVGITSKDDGQMMFLLNMISKMKQTPQGSRIASVHNGSSLFNSDSGQVAIRKHIIENDYLEAIIALPTKMFYNTDIPTFVWIITNRKKEEKKGKVQLINATSEKYYSKMKKSLGDKSNQMHSSHIEAITKLFLDYAQEGDALVLDNEDFGYTKVTIERPRQVKELLEDKRFNSLAQKETLLEKLTHLESHPQDFKDRGDFLSYLGVKLSKSEANLLINSDKKSNTEKIPLKVDIASYYENEVKPYVPNSWVDYESASVGYEILFNKYFYTYTPPRSMGEIKAELESLESEVQSLLSEIMQ